MLERDLVADDPNRRLVHKITEGVGRLNRIVVSLLNYTRPLSRNVHPVNRAELVDETTAYFSNDIARSPQDIRIERAFPADELICRVDPEQLQQVILNLLQNAMQAMQECMRDVLYKQQQQQPPAPRCVEGWTPVIDDASGEYYFWQLVGLC